MYIAILEEILKLTIFTPKKVLPPAKKFGTIPFFDLEVDDH